MSVLKARSRLVSFRLTQEELENLRVACVMQGGRNISDFARSAVLQLAEARIHPELQVLDRFSAVELRLSEIETASRLNGEMLRTLLKRLMSPASERARGA
jgi:hypothetical protein